ncbi:hypothetical protein [Pseudomonas sp. B28(2017)]|uniref:hypothetical protein n=1 Tax=Pseudomonas sp. B28(2017) TaxID=1981730 RepID=UPI000A1E1507|nr:hypothetical protein [Pseudomonas sp. B28(2017)]
MILGDDKKGCPVSRVLKAKISLEATLVGWISVENKRSQFCATCRDHSAKAAQGCDLFYGVTDLPAKTMVE